MCRGAGSGLRLGPGLGLDSEHPRSVFVGVVVGELHRLRETCWAEADFNFQVDFFFKNLAKRGYPWSLLNDCRKKKCWSDKHRLKAEPTQLQATRVIFSIRYSSKLKRVKIAQCINEHAHLLPDIRPLVGFTVGKNLFRLSCNRFFNLT